MTELGTRTTPDMADQPVATVVLSILAIVISLANLFWNVKIFLSAGLLRSQQAVGSLDTEYSQKVQDHLAFLSMVTRQHSRAALDAFMAQVASVWLLSICKVLRSCNK